MASNEKPPIGSVSWRDLTVPDASKVKEFYAQVVGWKTKDHDMGGYADYEMQEPESGQTVAGVCHARGINEGLPPQWLIYITVADVAASAKRCEELGGRVIHGPKSMGSQSMCVIEDPAGAVAALVGA